MLKRVFKKSSPFKVLLSVLSVLPLVACGDGLSTGISASSVPTMGSISTPSTSSSNTSSSSDHSDDDSQSDDTKSGNPTPVPESKLALDSQALSFQAKISKGLSASRYMEHDCQTVTNWVGWEGLPLQHCRYTTSGQTAEVLMLNAGPRRMTQWIQDACKAFSKNVTSCMDKTYKNILNQSGGQFPVAGIVIEDMDDNNNGNVYAFRNGVTVQIAAFGTGTEKLLTEAQIDKSFTQAPLKSYTYARPASVTRTDLNNYSAGLKISSIPKLSLTSSHSNDFNVLVGELYRDAWLGSKNHLIRAWVYKQNF